MELRVTLTLVLIALLAVFSALLLWRVLTLGRRFNQALSTSSGDSLEQVLTQHLQRVNQVDSRLAELEQEYQRLSVMAGLASQKISIVRFNPFGDTGGDQSFSLAILDSHDSGYVLTSIHGRGGTRIYAKPIDYGKSKYTLSKEEQKALDQAAKRVPRLEQHAAQG